MKINMVNFNMVNFKTAIIRAAIVLTPSYTMAFLTEKMVYVVPMLAATSFFAAAIDFPDSNIQRRVDSDDTDDGGDTIDIVIEDVLGGG